MYNYTFLFNEWWYVLILASVMILSGEAKQYNLFGSLYSYIIDKIKNKKLLVVMISFLGGILPIPGRVIVSAGLLDTIAPKDPLKRSKLGIIDYLATHHYYNWSILESTILIPMAVLSLSYWNVMYYLWPLLLSTIIFTVVYISTLKSEDIEISKNGINKITDIKPWYSFIKWDVIILLFGIILFGNFVKHYNSIFKELIQTCLTNHMHFTILSAAAFMASFILGSSSKFAGMVALLTSVFGLHYFTYFFALEYIGYILSPNHKCVYIGMSYFKTPIREYYKVLILWSLVLFGVGLISLL